jgi:hypothetical protein
MIKIYLLLLAVSIQFQLSAQAPGFNKRFPIEYPNTRIFKVLIENDTIIALGDGFSDTTLTEKGIVLMKFDTLGNLLHSKYIFDVNFHSTLSLFPAYGSLLKAHGGGYIMNITHFLFEFPMILKTDHDFNVEFIKQYQEPNDDYYHLCDMISDVDGYLMYGKVFRQNGFSDGFLRKIDIDGDSVWLKSYGASDTTEGINDVYKINDTLFAVSMVKTIDPNPFDESGVSVIKYINGNGEVLKEWESEPEPEIGYSRKILYADGERILVYGLNVVEEEPVPPFQYKIVKSTFSMLDEDFNIEWTKKYGRKSNLSNEIMFYDLKNTIDGNFICAGMTYTETSSNFGQVYNRGWLMKLSMNGDSIWGRQDTSDVLPISGFNKQRLGGVGVLSSGSIIAGGYVTRAEDNSSYCWLIKTTNDGCIDTLYCGLVSGTEEVPYVADVQRVSVYPNPAGEVVYIQVPDISGKAYMEISVFDLSGQQRKVLFADTESDTPLPVYDLPSGIYFISIKLPDGRVHYGKVCVAH